MPTAAGVPTRPGRPGSGEGDRLSARRSQPIPHDWNVAQMHFGDRKQDRSTLLNPAKRRSLLRLIRSGREFCAFV